MKKMALFLAVFLIFNLNCHQSNNPVGALSESQAESDTFSAHPQAKTSAPAQEQSDTTLNSAVPTRDGFEISGTVYVDADENGSKSSSESGIDNVVVTLVNASGNVIATTITDGTGDYDFRRGPGTYIVRIDPVTTAGSFNEQLNESFDPTSPTSLSVTIGPDSQDNDFGFTPKLQLIIQQIHSGTITSKSGSAKFWKRQFLLALQLADGEPTFSATALLGFLSSIENLFISVPFQFTSGNELQEALEILCTEADEGLAELLKELLVAELNEVSGNGINNAAGLQLALIAWGEGIANQNLRPRRRAAATLTQAIKLFRTLNSSGGGGGIGT